MTTTPWTRRVGALALISTLGVWAAACGDGTTEPHDDEHAEPVSIRLTLGGQSIATADVNEATGGIEVDAGEETGHITVEFVAEDGDVLDFDDEFYLEVDVADETVAAFEQDTPGEFGGHAHGEAAGRTTMTFKLMHGTVGSGHPDFIPADITVDVLDPSG